MNMQTRVKSRTIELADRLEQGITKDVLVKEYAEKWNCTPRHVYRMIELAKDWLDKGIKDRNNVVDTLRSELMADDYAENMKSNFEVETMLCKIIDGEKLGTKVIFDEKGSHVEQVSASIMERIRAAETILKLRGKIGITRKQAEAMVEQKVFNVPVKNQAEKEMIDAV